MQSSGVVPKSNAETLLSEIFPTQLDVKHNSDGGRIYSINSNRGILYLNAFLSAASVGILALAIFTSIPEFIALGTLCLLVAVPLTMHSLWERTQWTTLTS